MGWLFKNESREELIRDLTKPYDTEQVSCKTIAHAICHEGDYGVLWSVAELTAKQKGALKDLAPGQFIRLIRCDLLDCHKGQWGYASLGETMHPFYFSCPLSYLDMAPEQSAEWRNKVRAYHADRAANHA
ncbi:MAG: hypothetical protein LBV49_10830 [Azonexus sp.]|jgi:hypothetical protein|nr:hypothetical protein [Azonexus sp.]